MPRDLIERGELTAERLVRAVMIETEAALTNRSPLDVAKARFGYSADTAHAVRGLITKASQGPATTFTPGYAAELSQIVYAAWLDLLRDAGAFAKVPWNSVNLDTGKAIFPMRDETAMAAPDNLEATFRKEADPIRVGRMTTKSVELLPYTAGIISTFTRELFKRSTPNIEALVRQAMVDDTTTALDAIIFGTGAAVPDVRPAGLLNGIAAGDTRISSGSDIVAIDADLTKMIVTMMGAGLGVRPVWVMNTGNKVALSGKVTAQGLYLYRDELRGSSPTLKEIPVVTALTFPLDQVLLIDAQNVAFAGGTPSFEVSENATIHEENTTPLQVGGATTPVRSLYQTNSAAVRSIWEISWAKLRTHAVQQLTAVAW